MTTWILIVGWTLVHFVWQAALLAAIAACGLTLLRNATPESRYMLASTTLALMLLAPMLTVTWLSAPRVVPVPTATTPVTGVLNAGDVTTLADDSPSAPGSPRRAALVTPDRVFAVLVTVWLFGVLLLSLRLIRGWWQLRRLHRSGLTTPASGWQSASNRLACRLGLRRPVHVVTSEAIDVPSVLGWWRPVLLLPVTAFAGLTPTQAEAVLTHELAHIQRHDYLVNVLQLVAETVLFYHPSVWWISRRMRVERELCCDAVVVRLCGDAHDYATALMQLEEGRRTPTAALAIAATTRPLFDRIQRMLSGRHDRHQPVAHAAITAVMVLCFVLFIGGTYRWSTRTVHANVSAPAVVIGTVNQEPIFQSDLDHFRALHGAPASAPLSRVLAQLVDERLVVQRGRQLGFTAPRDEVDNAQAAMMRHQFTSSAQMDAALSKQHLTRNDLRQHLSRMVIAYHVRWSEAADRVVVTDAEAAAYFDAHADQFPLQTFELAKPDLIARLKRERVGEALAPQSYLQSLRAVANVRWTRPDLARAYADGLAALAPQAQAGTPVPGRLTTPTPEWHTTTTDHFEIFATPDVASQVGRVQQLAERAYQHVSADLRHDLDVRPSLVVFATGVAARAANGTTLPGGLTPSPRTLLPLDQPDDVFQATVTHEIAHTFEFDIVPGATLAAAPSWILEGLSEYEAGAWGATDQAMLRGLVRTDAVPALSAVDATLGQSNPRLPYSLGHAAFDFIAGRWGADGIRRLLLALRNGNVDRQTLYMAAWGVGADEVDRAFSAYLRAQFPASAAATPPDLPKCLKDAGFISVDFRDVTIPQVLTFLGRPCGVDVRAEGIAGTEASRVLPRVQFSQARTSDVFRILVDAAGLRYTVVDDQTLILTRQ